MSFSELHLDRDRAGSFGSVAEQYEAHRPAFPDPLLDDLAALGARRALDVACGTGKLGRGLARRGVDVLGVELDPRMAGVARKLGLPVEVARFEDWDDAGRQFDLVTCGDAWHWIDPRRGAEKVARVLAPGGVFALVWNLQVLEEPARAALAPVYRELAPEVFPYGGPPPPDASLPPLEGPFSPAEVRTYGWERRLSGAEWAAVMPTISDHQRRLTPERLRALQDGARAALRGLGETVLVRGTTTAMLARRLA
ncbi:MAG TPA: class I SAM-dependent methyltransferase [Myxococcales bacterium]|nr:class I SAM-dependent methyltransferase [Myxococcales bacterium]